MSFRIEHVHAFVALNEDDVEGIIGMTMGGIFMPFVAADPERMAQLRPLARQIAKSTGKPVKVLRFSLREDLGEP